MEFSRVKIVTFIPRENAGEVRRALGTAGAGVLGEYSFCSFSVVGKGRFLSSDKASPHIGESGVNEAVEEERVEVVCEKSKARLAIAAMKKAHPYEEVAFDIYPLLDEEQLA